MARIKSPSFPYIDIGEATTKIKTLYEKVKNQAITEDDFYKALSYTPTSSTSKRSLSTIIDYGLLIDLDSEKGKKIKITDLGRRISVDTREDVLVSLYRKATLNDSMMRKLWDEQWKFGLPDSDKDIISTLKADYGFSDRAADRFIKILRKNYYVAALDSYIEFNNEGELLQNRDQENGNSYNTPNQNEPLPNTIASDWLNFSINLKSGKIARLSFSDKISNKEYEFLKQWFELIEEDFIEKRTKEAEKNNNENVQEMTNDDIPF